MQSELPHTGVNSALRDHMPSGWKKHQDGSHARGQRGGSSNDGGARRLTRNEYNAMISPYLPGRKAPDMVMRKYTHGGSLGGAAGRRKHGNHGKTGGTDGTSVARPTKRGRNSIQQQGAWAKADARPRPKKASITRWTLAT